MGWLSRCKGLVFLGIGVWLAACAGAAPATLAPSASSPTVTAGPLVTVLPTVTAVTAATSVAGPTAIAAATDTPSAATATLAPVTTAGAGANGCPAAQVPAGAPAADVTASVGGAGGGAAQLKVGQVLEVRLPANTRWTLAVQDPAGALAPVAGNGWYDAAQASCVWRFTGQAAGGASLAYSGRAICKPGAVCANFVISEVFAVTVGK